MPTGNPAATAVAERDDALVLVRRERPDDEAAVREVTRAAFSATAASDPPAEVPLLDALRRVPCWSAPLSLVAEDDDGVVVGHVVATRGDVEGVPAVGLAPLSVHPGAQGRGTGSVLVHALVAAAEARDEVLVALLGEPGFYARLGFRPAADLGVEAPDPAWGRYFQARVLGGVAPRGRFTYAEPLRRL